VTPAGVDEALDRCFAKVTQQGEWCGTRSSGAIPALAGIRWRHDE
jgi:hypothetical protein